MTFQFMCPHGHLLQGDVSQMGMPCQCPHCGITFIIPRVEIQPQYAPVEQHVEQYAPHLDYTSPPPDSLHQGVSDFLGNLGPGAHAEPQHYADPQHHAEPHHLDEHFETAGETPISPIAADLDQLSTAATTSDIVHIPCPNGHALETPPDLIGQEVLCPHCGAQFLLRNEDSFEYKERQDRILAQRSELWFKWSIAAAAVVLLGLLGMFIVIASH